MLSTLQAFVAWWWVLPLAGAGLWCYRWLGWRGLLAVATLGLAAGLYTKGRQDQVDDQRRAEAAKRLKSQQDREAINREVDKLSPDDVRNDLSKWMRD